MPRLLTGLVVLSLLFACSEPPPPSVPRITAAVADLDPLAGRAVQGNVRFERTAAGGVRVSAEITGLKGRNQTYRVHQYGDCSDPRGRSAGEPLASGFGQIHEGSSDATGETTFNVTLPQASLTGTGSPIGRAVVVHRREPMTSDTPASFVRVACGVIGITEET